MIELRHLRTLCAIREKDSLMGAAEKMYVTQSALSHQIKDFEERIGSVLFMRNTHPVRFTPTGLRLLKLADEILPLIEHTICDLDQIAGGQAGRLLIAVECHSCFEWLMPAMETFRDKWSAVTMDLTTEFSFDSLSALARGDLDLIITSDPDESRRHLHYEPLFDYEAVLVMSPDHALIHKPYVEPTDLASETLIAYPIEPVRMDLFNFFLTPAKVTPADIRNTHLTPVIIQLVASGRGVACLPSWVAQEYSSRGLVVTRSLGVKGCRSSMFAAIQRHAVEVAFMQDFITAIKATCYGKI